MKEKMTTCEKEPTNLNVPFVRKKSLPGENVETTKDESYQRSEIRRTVKLPRLKLEDLISQVTEENAHGEISTGQAVGNEIW